MATFKYPKQGTVLTRKTPYDRCSKFIFQGAAYSIRGGVYLVTKEGVPTVKGWNWLTLEVKDFEPVADADMEVWRDAQGVEVEDDVYYTGNDGVEYRLLGRQETFDGYNGDEHIKNAAVIKRGCRSARNWQAMSIDYLSRSKPKQKLTKAQRAALEVKTVALEYIYKMCVGLGYDVSRLSEEQVDKFCGMYHTASKAVLNKAIMDLFDAMPPVANDFSDSIKNVLKFSPKFQQTDKGLKKLEDNVKVWKREVESVDRIIKDFDNSIAYYEKEIKSAQKAKVEYDTTHRKAYQEEYDKAQASLAEYLKGVDNASKDKYINNILTKLHDAIKGIVENSAGFYKFDSIKLGVEQIEKVEQLENVIVTFITNKVLGRDARVEGLCFDAGQFKCEWRPFNRSFQTGGLEFEKNMYSGQPDARIRPYKDNTIIDGYPHPHVRGDGSVCWGEISGDITRQLQFNVNYEFTGKPYECFNKIKALLHSYNANSPYKRLVEFAIKKHPELKDKLSTEFKTDRNNVVVYNPKQKKDFKDQYEKFAEDYYDKIHEVTVTTIRDTNGRTLPPTERKKASHLTCNTYIKRYVGVDNLVPKGENKKRYIKLQDNQFVELKANEGY